MEIIIVDYFVRMEAYTASSSHAIAARGYITLHRALFIFSRSSASARMNLLARTPMRTVVAADLKRFPFALMALSSGAASTQPPFFRLACANANYRRRSTIRMGI